MFVYSHTATQPGLRKHITQWNDCETSTCKDTNTQHKLGHKNSSTSTCTAHNCMHKLRGQTHACTQTHKNTHRTVSAASWFKSLAGFEFSCSQNALLLLLCLTGAWFELGPFYILSLLSSQHRGVPEGLCDPHFTYFDCFWEKLLFWRALSYWYSMPAWGLVSGTVCARGALFQSISLLPDENLQRFFWCLCFKLNSRISCLSKGQKFHNVGAYWHKRLFFFPGCSWKADILGVTLWHFF